MTVEELQVLITANTSDLNKKISSVNKKLDSLSQHAGKSGKGLQKAFVGIKATAAIAAINKVTAAVKKLTDAYAETESAQMGLSSILTAQGKDLNAAKSWLKDYVADGLIPLTDAYTAYKSLASAGYSDEQTQSIMQNLKDAAAFNRQGSMSMGDAVKSAAEGIKNENSVLVDNAGVTKNLSVIWDEYAESIGKTAANLTDTEKRIATTEGIMRETAFQTGDAAKYASTFAGAQAALKAQTKALSSALGSIFAPALQACTPPITELVSKLTLLAEKAGQVMSILFGTTSKASSSTAQLSNSTQKVSSNLDSATKKAKSYKKALLGIDEINLLGSPNSDSDTGGGSSSTTTVGSGNNLNSPLSDADKVIDPVLATRADEVREKISAIEPVVKGVAAGAAAAIGIKVLSGWFSGVRKVWSAFKGLKITSVFTESFAWIKETGGSTFQSLGYGLQKSTSVAKNSLKQFRSNLSTTQKAMIGAAGFAASLAMTQSAFKSLASGSENAKKKLAIMAVGVAAVGTAMTVTLGPIGLVITAVGAVTGAIIGFEQGADELAEKTYQASESYKILSENMESSQEIIQRTKDNMDNLNAKIANLDEVSSQYGSVELLVDEIYQLSEKSNKSTYEMELMRVKVDTLNSMNIDGLQLSIDETNGSIVQTKESIYKVIEAMKKQAETAALQEVLKESYKTLYQATVDNETATDNYKVASEELETAQKKLKDKTEELQKKNSGMSDGFRDIANWISQKLSPEYRTLKKNVEDASKKQAIAKQAIDDTSGAMETAKKKAEYYADELVTLKNNLNKLPKETTCNVTVNTNSRTSGAKAYASGGYPDRGQMFIARESGPELVGQIGGRTAVINNNQIIEGVSSGVEKGVERAMKYSSGGSMTITIINESGDVLQEIKDINMKAGRIVIPVDA